MAPKREKGDYEVVEKSTGLLNALKMIEGIASVEGGVAAMVTHLFLHIYDQMHQSAMRKQNPNI